MRSIPIDRSFVTSERGEIGDVQPIVELEQLTRVFDTGNQSILRRKSGSVTALDNVCLRVLPGECLALVGANGAGKSTLLKILAGLLTPSSGVARVAGVDVAKDPDKVRAMIGWSSNESRSFFLPISAIQNLVFFGQLQGMRRRAARLRASHLLDLLELGNWLDTPVADFSSGMLQRLSLARAMLHEPAVLLLDEPTANLDLAGRGLLIQIVRDYLTAGGKGVIVATHDAHLVAEIASQVLMLDKGRVVDRSRTLHPVVYTVQVDGVPRETLQRFGTIAESTSSWMLVSVRDLGDGFALAAVISEVVALGGSVLSVERQPTHDVEKALERSIVR